jgi:hypothetical protein
MIVNKEKMKRGQSFSMNFKDQEFNMDHSKTQRMKLTKIRQAKRNKGRKIQKRMIPSIVANFVIRQIDNCIHKLISLTSTRS